MPWQIAFLFIYLIAILKCVITDIYIILHLEKVQYCAQKT